MLIFNVAAVSDGAYSIDHRGAAAGERARPHFTNGCGGFSAGTRVATAPKRRAGPQVETMRQCRKDRRAHYHNHWQWVATRAGNCRSGTDAKSVPFSTAKIFTTRLWEYAMGDLIFTVNGPGGEV